MVILYVKYISITLTTSYFLQMSPVNPKNSFSSEAYEREFHNKTFTGKRCIVFAVRQPGGSISAYSAYSQLPFLRGGNQFPKMLQEFIQFGFLETVNEVKSIIGKMNVASLKRRWFPGTLLSIALQQVPGYRTYQST
jgi:hypothetical protein